MAKAGVFSLNLAKQAKPLLENMIRDRGAETPRQPKKSGGGAIKKPCPDLWTLYPKSGAGGVVTSGDFSLDLKVDDGNGGVTDESVTVPFDATADDLRLLLETIPGLLDSNDDLVVTLRGGPLQRVGIVIVNHNATGQRILSIDWSDNTFDSGSPYVQPHRA